MMRRAAAPLLLATLAAAPADTPDVAKALAGRTAGAAVNCVDLSQIQGPQIVDATTILYRQSGRRVWRTGPVGACPALRPIATLIVQVYGGQLCRNNRFQVLDANSTIPSGYCRFTRFTPYDKPPK